MNLQKAEQLAFVVLRYQRIAHKLVWLDELDAKESSVVPGFLGSEVDPPFSPATARKIRDIIRQELTANNAAAESDMSALGVVN